MFDIYPDITYIVAPDSMVPPQHLSPRHYSKYHARLPSLVHLLDFATFLINHFLVLRAHKALYKLSFTIYRTYK
jgi:hypothetical protein